jgi:hypothetical protein
MTMYFLQVFIYNETTTEDEVEIRKQNSLITDKILSKIRSMPYNLNSNSAAVKYTKGIIDTIPFNCQIVSIGTSELTEAELIEYVKIHIVPDIKDLKHNVTL